MDRKSNKQKVFKKKERDAIKRVANGIASHGLDAERVFKAMLQTVHSVESFDPLTLKIYNDIPNFQEVLNYLSPDLTLKLFEEQDLIPLGDRLRFAKLLANEFNFFYNLSDWQSGLSQLIEHQSSNKQSLENEGYPAIEFTSSPWLSWKIGLLYPVKQKFSEENGHSWRRQTGHGDRLFGDPCEYPDADYLPFLSDAECHRFDNTDTRSRFLDFRQHVLGKLINVMGSQGPDAIGASSAIDLVNSCFQEAAGMLHIDEIEFLQSIDDRYNEIPFPLDLTDPSQRPIRNGGLSDIICVVGHVAQELAIRSVSDVRIRMQSWEDTTGTRVGIKFDLKDFYSAYATETADWFEKFYLQYVESQESIKDFWDRFNQHIPEVMRVLRMPEKKRAHEPKPSIIVNRRTKTITISRIGNTEKYKPIKRADRIIEAVSFALDKCKNKMERNLPVFFLRNELCEHLGLGDKTTMAQIFRGTPFWSQKESERLIKSIPGRNRYTIHVDLKKSKI